VPLRVDQIAQLGSLASDLGTIGEVEMRVEVDDSMNARARLVYRARPVGLFGSPLPPEYEVGRLLRFLSERRRFVIEREELDGRRYICRLPSGVEAHVELEGAGT